MSVRVRLNITSVLPTMPPWKLVPDDDVTSEVAEAVAPESLPSRVCIIRLEAEGELVSVNRNVTTGLATKRGLRELWV